MNSPIIKAKFDKRFIGVVIAFLWLFYALNNSILHVSLNCMKYANNTGSCEIIKKKIIGRDKKTLGLGDISDVYSKLSWGSRSNSTPDLYFKTSSGDILVFPSYSMTRGEVIDTINQLKGFLSVNGPTTLNIYKDASMVNFFGWLIVFGILFYVFKDSLKPKKKIQKHPVEVIDIGENIITK